MAATPSIAPHAKSDANSITLREYVDARFNSQEQAMSAALAAADRAVAKAEAASEKRFEAVNEFRASLNDQTRTLVPRAEHEQAVRALSEKIEVLTARVNQRDDRGRGMGALSGWIVSAILLVVAVAGLVIKVAAT